MRFFFLLIFLLLKMTLRQRQSSLRNLQPERKSLTFSPQRLLPTISEHKQIKKSTAKQLSQVISRFNSLNKKQTQEFSDELLRSAMTVLKAFSNVENNFQELFGDLYHTLRRFTYAIQDPELLALLSHYRIKQGCSMRKTCFMMDKQLQFIMKNRNEKIADLSEKYSALKSKSQIQEIQWKEERTFLIAQVERCKKLSDIQYTRELEKNIDDLKTKISELQTQVKHLTKDNEQFLKELDHNENTIADLNYDNAQLKADIYDLKKRQDNIEGYFKNLQNRFDQLLVKMIGIKQNIAKVQQENENLVSQRAKLVNRAAVGFQQLTPRPKYNEIFNISLKKHINSTKDIFANIVENSGMEYKDIISKIILKKRNYKLEETQAIRNQVVEDIIQAKKQMKKI